MKRPEYDAAVNVVGTVNVLQASPGAQVIYRTPGSLLARLTTPRHLAIPRRRR